MAKGKTICTVCNYIYDEQLGEPRQEISPEIPFETLPDNWTCPECNSQKEMFQPCSCVSLHVYELSCVKKKDDPASALLKKSLGQLVAERPERACIFEQYGLEYCCGGKKTLEQALLDKNLPIDEVVARLIDASENKSDYETDWTVAPLKELTDHIVNTYHEPLRVDLARLTKLVEKVAIVHGKAHPELNELETVFKLFREELELHMKKEEVILFPGIVNVEAGRQSTFGCGGSIDHPIEMMTQEHESAGEAFEKMRRLTNNYTPPDDACDTFKVLMHSLANLELVMHQHVHKENNILFPRALAMAKSLTRCT